MVSNCAAPPQEPSASWVQKGNACWDQAANSNRWEVSDGSATDTESSYSVNMSWTVPGQIAGEGGSGTLSVSVTGGVAERICVLGAYTSFALAGGDANGDSCAQTSASKGSASATPKLLPDDAADGTIGYVWVSLGDGGNLYYSYKASTPTQPPPPGPPPPSAKERCLGKGFATDYTRATTRPQAHGAALNEVHVVKVCPDVQFHKGGTPADAWLPVEVNTVLKQGDEITCDPDGVVVLAFADNSTTVVSNTTQLSIASYFTEGGVVRTEILLKMGEVAAQVNKSEATKSDFRIKEPTATDSVRGAGDGGRLGSGPPAVSATAGTSFTTFYAPGSQTTLVSATSGTVTVTPSRGSSSSIPVSAGNEVEVTRGVASPVGPIGKVGLRGGNDIVAAQERVSAVVGKARKACGDTSAHSDAFSITPAANGWTVAVKLGGKVKGTALFSVSGTRVTPLNALARKLVAGCR